MNEYYNKIFSLLNEEGLILKDLTFWCKLKLSQTHNKPKWYLFSIIVRNEYGSCSTLDYFYDETNFSRTENYSNIQYDDKKEIIWHKPQLQDVLRWFELKNCSMEIYKWQIIISEIEWETLWFFDFNLSKYLENQDLEYLYNLMISINNN